MSKISVPYDNSKEPPNDVDAPRPMRCSDSIPDGFVDLVSKLSDFECGSIRSFWLRLRHPIWFRDANRIAKEVMIRRIMEHYDQQSEPEKLRIMRIINQGS